MAVTAALLLLVVCQGAAALLVVAGRRHRRDRPLLKHHLRAHDVVPRWAIDGVSRVMPIASLGTGITVLAVSSAVAPGWWPTAARVTAGALAVVYLVFLTYLLLLHRRAPELPCGCLGAGDQRSGHSLVRAVVVAVAASIAASPWPLPALTGVPGWPVLVLLASAVGVGTAAAVAGPAVRATGAPITTL